MAEYSGAVVVMDALGTRAQVSKEKFLEQMAQHGEEFAAEIDRTNFPGGRALLRARKENLLDLVTLDVAKGSDTLVITVAYKRRQPAPGAALLFACQYAAKAMRLALEQPMPFAYRGAIAVGEFEAPSEAEAKRPGSALAEALEACEYSEGSFVWMRPSAASVAVQTPPTAAYLPWAVPFGRRGADRIAHTFAVPPCTYQRPASEWPRTHAKILATFAPGHETKRSNTAAFLDYTLLRLPELQVG